MNKCAIASLAAIMIVATSPATGGEAKTPSDKAGRIVVISIALPFVLGSAAVFVVNDSLKGDSSSGDPDKGGQVKAEPLPPMRVAAKKKIQAGGDEITLVHVDGFVGGEPTILRFPAVHGSPANLMSAGDVVTFTPAGEANGWWVKSEDGNNLAYVPTSSTAKLSGSKAL